MKNDLKLDLQGGMRNLKNTISIAFDLINEMVNKNPLQLNQKNYLVFQDSELINIVQAHSSRKIDIKNPLSRAKAEAFKLLLDTDFITCSKNNREFSSNYKKLQALYTTLVLKDGGYAIETTSFNFNLLKKYSNDYEGFVEYIIDNFKNKSKIKIYKETCQLASNIRTFTSKQLFYVLIKKNILCLDTKFSVAKLKQLKTQFQKINVNNCTKKAQELQQKIALIEMIHFKIVNEIEQMLVNLYGVGKLKKIKNTVNEKEGYFIYTSINHYASNIGNDNEFSFGERACKQKIKLTMNSHMNNSNSKIDATLWDNESKKRLFISVKSIKMAHGASMVTRYSSPEDCFNKFKFNLENELWYLFKGNEIRHENSSYLSYYFNSNDYFILISNLINYIVHNSIIEKDSKGNPQVLIENKPFITFYSQAKSKTKNSRFGYEAKILNIETIAPKSNFIKSWYGIVQILKNK